MVKLHIMLLLLLITSLNATPYESNCVECHKKLPVSIDKYFYRYLLKYSSEEDVKKKITEYLKRPSKKISVMPEAFIERFGVKKSTQLNDKELTQAVDSYWNHYKVFGRLK
jgi:hypothetical protein